MQNLHLGILQADTVLAHFQSEFGDYPAMFRTLFDTVDANIRFSNFDVQQGLPARLDCDAYLITGSRHSVYDDLAWIQPLVKFLEQVLQANKKIIGVCFGHQLMAHFFGGRVEANCKGWAVGVHASTLVRQAHWMHNNAQSFQLISSHQDQVCQLPSNAEVFASNEFCPIAGFTMGNQVITVQGHPEFKKSYAQVLMDYRRELLGEAVYVNGVASLENSMDPALVAQWMLNFVRR